MSGHASRLAIDMRVVLEAARAFADDHVIAQSR
jgi:hypothetical protein